jgi:hypothetical protein
MRLLITLSFLLSVFALNAQLSGELKTDNRKLLTPFNYLVKSTTPGIAVFEITVDIDGNVTSATVLKDETTIRSTPTLMAVKNELLQLKFQKGYTYPKFHRGKVTVHVERREE